MEDENKFNELEKAWNKLILTIAKELKLDKLLDWLEDKLSKIKFFN